MHYFSVINQKQTIKLFIIFLTSIPIPNPTHNVFKLDVVSLLGPPRGYGEQGNNVIYFRGTGEHQSKNEGNIEN